MQRILIKDLVKKSDAIGESVRVCGWVRSKRGAKGVSFVVVNDGSSQADLQVVVDADSLAAAELKDCSTGAAIQVDGIVKESRGKGQAIEIAADKLKIWGPCASDYPLQKKGHTLEFLRDIGHLRARSHTFGAVFRIRNQLAMLIHEFFQSKGFYWAHTPILTASDCEGAGEMFRVTQLDIKNTPLTKEGTVDWSKDFFGKPAHLTVSGQLNGEALALSMGSIYTFGPTFRAENSNTTRHLAEFWMVEPEVAFADLQDNALLAEEFLKFVFSKVAKNTSDELDFLAKHYPCLGSEGLTQLASKPFERISYTDAISILEKAKMSFEFPVSWGVDLQTEHERFLTDEVFNGPVIVTDYPKQIKAFYMRLNSDEKTVAAMDVLMPRIGEIIGGSQREDRYDLLVNAMNSFQIPQEDLHWYLELRKFGGAPHAGFGLGFERLVQYVTGMTNIRDVIAFPRFPGGISF